MKTYLVLALGAGLLLAASGASAHRHHHYRHESHHSLDKRRLPDNTSMTGNPPKS